MSVGEVRSQAGWFAMAAALVLCAFLGSSAFERNRSRSVRKVDVTGSARKRIVSDLIEWRAGVEVQAPERIKAYRALNANVQEVMAYLAAQGVKREELRACR